MLYQRNLEDAQESHLNQCQLTPFLLFYFILLATFVVSNFSWSLMEWVDQRFEYLVSSSCYYEPLLLQVVMNAPLMMFCMFWAAIYQTFLYHSLHETLAQNKTFLYRLISRILKQTSCRNIYFLVSEQTKPHHAQ